MIDLFPCRDEFFDDEGNRILSDKFIIEKINDMDGLNKHTIKFGDKTALFVILVSHEL